MLKHKASFFNKQVLCLLPQMKKTEELSNIKGDLAN